MLLHRNVIANVLQSEVWNQPVMAKIPAGEQPTGVCALPLYHIFAFTVGMMLSMRMGGKLMLIPNPRDMRGRAQGAAPSTRSTASRRSTRCSTAWPITRTSTRSTGAHLKVSVGGGTAVQSAVAKLWLEKTGCPICEGYGLSETTPSASCNPITSTEYTGTIGVPLPNTDMKLLDDDGEEVACWASPAKSPSRDRR